jgi:ferredoxin-NADP reductase
MKLTLIKQQLETSDVITFSFQPDQPVTWQPGQFIKYQLPLDPSDDRGESRYFTISAAPFENEIHITTRIASEHGSAFKSGLQHLQAGDQVEASEPMGEFIVDQLQAGHVFISGGIGITPYRSILAQAAHDNQMPSIALLYANRNDQFVFKSELDAITKAHPTLSITYLVEPQRIQLADIQQATQKLQKDTPYYYISGPKPMVEGFKQTLIDSGIQADFIKTDYFPGYKD